MEGWRPVLGYEHLYEASTLGRIRRLPAILNRGRRWAGRVMRPRVDRFGYLCVSLCKDGIASKRRVHVIVAEAFHGPRPPGYHAAHLNGSKQNNAPSNLRWSTPKGNEQHKELHGTVARGI